MLPTALKKCRQRSSPPTISDNEIGPPILCLLPLRCPPAISRLIIAVVVFPLYRMLGRRARPHVLEEVFVNIPSPANLDAAATVALISSAIGIHAPLSH